MEKLNIIEEWLDKYGDEETEEKVKKESLELLGNQIEYLNCLIKDKALNDNQLNKTLKKIHELKQIIKEIKNN